MTAALQSPGGAGNLGRVTDGYNQPVDSNNRRTVTRPRLELSDKDKDLGPRFARRLRKLMETHGWSSRDVAELVTKGGVAVGDRAVDAWLRGQRLPKLKDIEKVGRALGFDDYRDLLPEPLGKSKGRSG
jgi:ribosome-binding protein aMBF1 (putative translation factor)